MNKEELRRHIKRILRGHTPSQLYDLSQPIVQRLLAHPKVQQADTIILYHSLPDEVYTHALLDTLLKQGKRILLPKVMSETQMTLHEYYGPNSLTKGAFGILEPNNDNEKISVKIKVNVIIVPGVAFDRQGNRLGRGKGYYDRLLVDFTTTSFAHIYKIGVCFPFQVVESIPHSFFDIPMDEVVF